MAIDKHISRRETRRMMRRARPRTQDARSDGRERSAGTRAKLRDFYLRRQSVLMSRRAVQS